MTEACPQRYLLVRISCASNRRLRAGRVRRRRKARRPSPPQCPSRGARKAILLRTKLRHCLSGSHVDASWFTPLDPLMLAPRSTSPARESSCARSAPRRRPTEPHLRHLPAGRGASAVRSGEGGGAGAVRAQPPKTVTGLSRVPHYRRLFIKERPVALHLREMRTPAVY